MKQDIPPYLHINQYARRNAAPAAKTYLIQSCSSGVIFTLRILPIGSHQTRLSVSVPRGYSLRLSLSLHYYI